LFWRQRYHVRRVQDISRVGALGLTRGGTSGTQRGTRARAKGGDGASVWAQECYLISKCTEACTQRDYERAYKFLCARADLLKENTPYRFSGFMFDEVFMRLSSFPACDCVAFLRRYAAPCASYLRVVESKAILHDAENSEYVEVLDAAVEDHPSDGLLLKEIALFWARRKEYRLAKKYCEIAVSRNLSDGTKSGFSGRLKRLERKAERCAPPTDDAATPLGNSEGLR
jgi:hypothetical protein